MTYVAYVDESEPDQLFDPGAYILCAAIVQVEAQVDLREALNGLRRSNQRKVHWHDEPHRVRVDLVSTIAGLGVEHVVVVRDGGGVAPSERRRRLCLERLCYDLALLGVEHIIIESRGPSDKLDRRLIDSLRAKKLLSSSIRIDHIAGAAEPLLWIADIACGAVAQLRRGNSTFFDPLSQFVTLVSI